jgi:hypothetical protein
MFTSFVSLGRSRYFGLSLLALSTLFVASVAAAAISFVSYSQANSNDVTYTLVTVSPPASTAAGNLLLANISISGGSQANVTPPSGWTEILRTDNDTSISVISYYKIASASEPSNYTWTIDHQTTAKGTISQYTGIDSSNPIDSSAGNTGFGTIATTTSLTTSLNNEQIVTLYAIDVGKSANAGSYFSTPTGMTERYDLSNTPFGPSSASDDAIQAAAGSSGSNSTTISGSKARNWVSQQIALRRRLPSTPPSVNGSVTTEPINGVATSSVIFSHTVGTGNNQLLIVTAGAGGSNVDTSAKYDGIPMALGTAHGAGTEEYYDYWYLVNPPQGTHDVVVTFPYDTTYRQYAAITVDNVDQSAPLDTDTHVGGYGGNPSASITTTEPNELVLYFLDYDDRSTNLVYTPNDGQLYWVNNDSSGSTLGNQGAVHTQTATGTISVGGTATGSGPWDLIALPIRAEN